MSLPTISVVMPHYNHGRYVEQAAAAILGQSAPPLEFILIDDASTDGSLEALRRVARDPRVRLIQHQKNRGISETLIEGIRAARGEYVFGPAADDLALPGLFEKSLRLLAAHPGAGLCSALAGVMDEQGREREPYRTRLVRRSPAYLSPEEFLAEQRRGDNWVVSYSAIFRREPLLKLLEGAPDLHPGLDGLMIYGLGARHGACFLPERLVLWRPSPGSASGRLGLDPAAGLSYAERLLGALETLGDYSPEDIALLRRRSYEDLLGSLSHAPVFPEAAAREIAAKLPGDDAWLRAYQAAMAAGGGRWATRAYLYPRRPAKEMLRIAGRKLGLVS